MDATLQQQLAVALERSHRLGTIGGDLEDQLAHCASFSFVLGEEHADAREPGDTEERGDGWRTGVDLGTGGGLPGLALAGAWPRMQWTLVEMRAARADEVERTVLRLGWSDRVQVRTGEAQALGHDEDEREQFDVAVARAFGPASLTAECAAGLVKVGGVLIVSEPPEDLGEQRWDSAGLEVLGFGAPKYRESGTHRFAVFRKTAPCPDRFPRLPARSTRGWPRVP